MKQLPTSSSSTPKDKNDRAEKNEALRKRGFKPCPICEKAGFPELFHAERNCRRRNNPSDKYLNKNIKVANNAELENELNKEITDQKN